MFCNRLVNCQTPEGKYPLQSPKLILPVSKFLAPIERDFLLTELANQNDIEAPVLKAIVEVESCGAGFYPLDSEYAGKCKVRFEADYFQKFASTRPFFLPPSLTVEASKNDSKYNGRMAYEQAILQSPSSAIKATSFGIGQVMGFNYERAGYTSLIEFSNAMEESEANQLRAFVKFVISNPALLVAAQQRDFVTIARLYNGANYLLRGYDKKLISAYQALSRKKVPA